MHELSRHLVNATMTAQFTRGLDINRCTVMAVSADHRWIAFRGGAVWDTRNTSMIHFNQTGYMDDVVFSADSKLIAMSDGLSVMVFDIESQTLLWKSILLELGCIYLGSNSVAFSADSKYL